MNSAAREEPNNMRGIDGCRRLPGRTACVSATPRHPAFTTVFSSRLIEEGPAGTFR